MNDGNVTVNTDKHLFMYKKVHVIPVKWTKSYPYRGFGILKLSVPMGALVWRSNRTQSMRVSAARLHASSIDTPLTNKYLFASDYDPRFFYQSKRLIKPKYRFNRTNSIGGSGLHGFSNFDAAEAYMLRHSPESNITKVT